MPVNFNEEYYTRQTDKAKWGPGPWVAEPDKLVWVDEATGLDCMIHRGPAGALCGYVGVPLSHQLYGEDYDQVHVDAYGGLTYAAACNEEIGICHIPQPNKPDNLWWLGFDCGHPTDVIPCMEHVNREMYQRAEQAGDLEGMALWSSDSDWLGIVPTYKTVDFVVAEVERLAGQLV